MSQESKQPGTPSKLATPRAGIVRRQAKAKSEETAATDPDLGALLSGDAMASTPLPPKGSAVQGKILRIAGGAIFIGLPGGLEGVLPHPEGVRVKVGDSLKGVVRVEPVEGTPITLSPLDMPAPQVVKPAEETAPAPVVAPASPAAVAAPVTPAPVVQAPVVTAPVVEEEEEDFAALLADHLETQPKLFPGDQITGAVESISGDTVFVNVGAKSEGVISLEEFKDSEGNVTLKVGDDVTAYVVDAHSQAGGVVLSKTMGLGSNPMEAIEEAHIAGLPVEGTISGRNKGGFNVKIGKVRAFLPLSQVELHRVEEAQLDDYVGQSFRFKISQIKGRDVVVSRSALIKEESAEIVEKMKSELEPEMIVEGRVRSIKPYGAFIELAPGLDGLLHISEMSWGRISDPREILSEGQQITCQVLKYDAESGKLSLGLRQLGDDPWEKAASELNEGQTVSGKVVRLTPFGAFVTLFAGVDGLLHISNMTWDRRIRSPEEMVKVGDMVDVQVLSIDRGNRRISLGLKQLGGDPWDNAAETYAMGTMHEGKVEKVERFGIFVNLAPGVTGLLPMGQVDDKHQGGDASRNFPIGSMVKVSVLELRAGERKVTLSQKALDEAGDLANFKQYQSAQTPKKGGAGKNTKSNKPPKSFGTLAEMFSGFKAGK